MIHPPKNPLVRGGQHVRFSMARSLDGLLHCLVDRIALHGSHGTLRFASSYHGYLALCFICFKEQCHPQYIKLLASTYSEFADISHHVFRVYSRIIKVLKADWFCCITTQQQRRLAIMQRTTSTIGITRFADNAT